MVVSLVAKSASYIKVTYHLRKPLKEHDNARESRSDVETRVIGCLYQIQAVNNSLLSARYSQHVVPVASCRARFLKGSANLAIWCSSAVAPTTSCLMYIFYLQQNTSIQNLGKCQQNARNRIKSEIFIQKKNTNCNRTKHLLHLAVR